MRIDKNFLLFVDHTDWYTIQKGVGYVPTKKAPPEAVEAMKKVNEFSKK